MKGSTSNLFTGCTRYQGINSAVLSEPIPIGDEHKIVSIGTEKQVVGINRIEGANVPSTYWSIGRVISLVPTIAMLTEAAKTLPK